MESEQLPVTGIKNWSGIIKNITSPLGIVALTQLVICTMLSLVLTLSNFSEDRQWTGFCMLFWFIVAMILIFVFLVLFKSKNLVFSEQGYIEECKQKLEELKLMGYNTDNDSTGTP